MAEMQSFKLKKKRVTQAKSVCIDSSESSSANEPRSPGGGGFHVKLRPVSSVSPSPGPGAGSVQEPIPAGTPPVTKPRQRKAPTKPTRPTLQENRSDERVGEEGGGGIPKWQKELQERKQDHRTKVTTQNQLDSYIW